jgi:hypothetical protein
VIKAFSTSNAVLTTITEGVTVVIDLLLDRSLQKAGGVQRLSLLSASQLPDSPETPFSFSDPR